MSIYDIALFVHVVGAVLLFAAVTVEGLAIRLLRQAMTGLESIAPMAMFRVNRVIGPLSALGILVPGLYMTAFRGWAPWIVVGLATWALILVLGAVNGIRTLAFGRRLPTDGGPISADLQARLRDPIAVVSWWTRAGMALGIVFLMTVKPGVVGTVAAIVVGAAAGMAIATRDVVTQVVQNRPARAQ